MNAQEEHIANVGSEYPPSPVTRIPPVSRTPVDEITASIAHRSLVLHFIDELRRRRVCRAATMYAVTMWLICQVVELIFPALGLPDWTVTLVIVLGLICFPVTLILSWMIEITPDGLIVDNAGHAHRVASKEDQQRRPLEVTIDCSLLLVALIIGAQMTLGAFSSETSAAAVLLPQRVAVLPFDAASGRDTEALSHGLLAELQRELSMRRDITVIAPRDTYPTASVRLAGSVAVGESQVRVNVIIVDNLTEQIIWSQAFEQPMDNAVVATVRLAQDIAAALPFSREAATKATEQD
jgi:TolB-like protein